MSIKTKEYLNLTLIDEFDIGPVLFRLYENRIFHAVVKKGEKIKPEKIEAPGAETTEMSTCISIEKNNIKVSKTEKDSSAETKARHLKNPNQMDPVKPEAKMNLATSTNKGIYIF